MPDRITNNVNPTPQEVREWGYDKGLQFLEQDEDLIFYGQEYLRVLLELAADDKCPKQGYAFGILCDSCRESVLHRRRVEMQAIQQALRSPPLGATQRHLVSEWAAYVGRLLEYATRSGPVDAPKALAMARDLLIGPAPRGAVVETGRDLASWWEFTHVTSITEYVYVNQMNGHFVYSRFWPLSPEQLAKITT